YFLTGSSKSIAAGLRAGYLVCPAAAACQQMAAAVRTTIWETPPLPNEFMTQWIESGAANEVVAWKQKEIEERHRLALEIFGDVAVSPRGHASCHLWITLPESWSESGRHDDFTSQCRQRGVEISPARVFAVGDEP